MGTGVRSEGKGGGEGDGGEAEGERICTRTSLRTWVNAFFQSVENA